MAKIVHISKIQEILKNYIEEASGDTIERLYKENLDGEIKYTEDSFFEVSDEVAETYGIKGDE